VKIGHPHPVLEIIWNIPAKVTAREKIILDFCKVLAAQAPV